MSLKTKQCKSCLEVTSSMTPLEFAPLLSELKGWQVVKNKSLRKVCKLRDFAEALHYANKIGALAEEQGHHPDLLVKWGELQIELFTHKVGGLTEADFVLAAKIDEILG